MRKSQLPTTVLIVRLSPASEILMATPVAATLKNHNPNTRIIWVTQPKFCELLSSNPLIDRVIEWDREKWRKLSRSFSIIEMIKELKALKETLHEEKIDIAIDLQGLFKSGLITRLSGAPLRIGLGSKEGSNWFMTRSVSKKNSVHELMGSQYKYLVEQLGYSKGLWPLTFHISSEEDAKATKFLHEKAGKFNYAIISPFSSNPQNQWNADNWKHFALRLRGRYQLRCVIVGNSEDHAQANELAKACGAINLCGELNYQQAGSLIRNSKLTIGVDNDYTHMAHIFETPSIALFGATCPYRYTGTNNSKIIYLDRFCSPCKKNPTCKGRYQCMQDISPDLVLTELKRLLRPIQL
jgi:heptosyltransferase-1